MDKISKALKAQMEAEAMKAVRQMYGNMMLEFAEKFTEKLIPILEKLGFREELINSKQACFYLNVSSTTLYTFINEKGMPYENKGPYLFKRSSISEWLKKQGKGGEDYKTPLQSEIENVIHSIELEQA